LETAANRELEIDIGSKLIATFKQRRTNYLKKVAPIPSYAKTFVREE